MIVRCKGRTRVAAGLLSGGLLLAILIPLTIGILLASLELYTMASNVNDEAFVNALNEDRDPARFSDYECRRVRQRIPAERAAGDSGRCQDDDPPEVRDSLIGIGDRSLGMVSTTSRQQSMWSASCYRRRSPADRTDDLPVGALLLSGGRAGTARSYSVPDSSKRVAPERAVLQEFAKAVRSVVLATFMAAIAQGVATTVALQMFGFGHLFALLILSTCSH